MNVVRRKSLLLCLAMAAPAAAQNAPEFPAPAPEHALLQRFHGEWDVASECTTGPDSPPMKSAGVIRSESLGDRWVINQMEIEAGPTTVNGVQTIGYDPAKSKYVGTWVDSMMNHLWVYEGDYDQATRTLTLHTTGPNLMGGGEMVPYRDTYRFVDDDHIESRSEARGEDGEWVTFMSGQMRRKAD